MRSPPHAGPEAAAVRALSIFVSIVVAFPLAGGLAPLAAPPQAAPAPGPLVAPLPLDLPDADLVLLLAHHAGIPAARPLLAPPPADATVESLALKLAHRSGAPHATPMDFAGFARLDPRVAAPLVTLLAAIDQAWDLRDHATRDLPAGDQRALARLVLDGHGATPEALALGEPLDKTALLEAAILLLDAAESIAIPALQEAARNDAWPAEPLADPLGILRIGGTGDDHETLDRLLQIDARGNDTYENNAGGTTLLADLDPTTLDYPIAVSVDFEGDDVYVSRTPLTQGAGFLGIGMLVDFVGDDAYQCLRLCQGTGPVGIGFHRDVAGADIHYAGDDSVGSGTLLGFHRDDVGNDSYRAGTDSGGFGFGESGVGILWDRSGVDSYNTTLNFSHNRYGWAEASGRGYFVEEGEDIDWYATQDLASHGCNGCGWQRGPPNAHGFGNDAYGGMAFLLAQQERVG